MDVTPWPGDGPRTGERTRACRWGYREGVFAIGSERRDFAWALSGAGSRGDGVVRSTVAGAHSPTDARDVAKADCVGHSGGVHAMVAALAACCSQQPSSWGAWDARDRAADAGFRGAGKRVGEADSPAAGRGL